MTDNTIITVLDECRKLKDAVQNRVGDYDRKINELETTAKHQLATLNKENATFKASIENMLPYLNVINDPLRITAADYVIWSLAGKVTKESFSVNKLPADIPSELRSILDYTKQHCCYDVEAKVTKITTTSDSNTHIGISGSLTGFIKGASTFGAELFYDEDAKKVERNKVLQVHHHRDNWIHRNYWYIGTNKKVWLFSPFLIPNMSYKSSMPAPLTMGKR